MANPTPPLDVGVPQLLVDYSSDTGEGPLWHDENQTLNWVDIPAGKLFRFDPATGKNDLIYQHDGQVGGYTIQADGSLVLFCDRGAILRLMGDMPEWIIPEIEALRKSRFNDVIADPEGRIYAGTMPWENNPAQLYRLDPDGTLTLVMDDLTQANGMGFSPDLTALYLTDSNSRQIYQIDFDQETGELANRRPFVRTPDDGTVPDGMTVDAEGNIWSARYGGSSLYKYGPKGDLLGKVEFPVRNITSVTFGGQDYNTAFVTTAGGTQRSAELGVLAGSLFGINLKTSGRAPFRSRIGM